MVRQVIIKVEQQSYLYFLLALCMPSSCLLTLEAFPLAFLFDLGKE